MAAAEAADVPCAPAAGVDASGTMLERGYGCEEDEGQGQLPLPLARRLLSPLHRPLPLLFPPPLVSAGTSWQTTG